MSVPTVYPANTEVLSLRTAEHFVLHSARLWVARRLDPQGFHPDLEAGFDAAGLSEDALAAFTAMFETVATAARRSVDIRCLRCTLLSPDEALLLQTVATCQRRRPGIASVMLTAWLPPAAMRIAGQAADRFAAGLAEVGLVLPWRHGEAATAPESADRGLALVQ